MHGPAIAASKRSRKAYRVDHRRDRLETLVRQVEGPNPHPEVQAPALARRQPETRQVEFVCPHGHHLNCCAARPDRRPGATCAEDFGAGS